MQTANFALGMSDDQIRAIAGKPRHIDPDGIVWRFGDDREPIGPYPIGDPFYWLPTVEIYQFSTEAFSLDNSLCDDTEISFIEAANSLIDDGVQASFADEIPNCIDASLRIAARVEQGMSINQILELVGRPVEVTNDGIWRYAFASEFTGITGIKTDPVPKIYFDVSGVTDPIPDDSDFVVGSSGFENIGGSYLVRGYTSTVDACITKI